MQGGGRKERSKAAMHKVLGTDCRTDMMLLVAGNSIANFFHGNKISHSSI